MVAEKIMRWEFVEMGKIGPKKQRQSRKVTDIFTWLQCYMGRMYVSAQFPEAVPELMAY